MYLVPCVGTFTEKGCPVACRVESGITGPFGALRATHVGRAGVGGAAGSHWIPHFSVEQKLSGSHKALVEMQDVVSELLRSVPREHPATKDPLLRVQEVLNGTEVNLQHLTALVDCRSLHLVRPLGSWGWGGGEPPEREGWPLGFWWVSYPASCKRHPVWPSK